MSHLWIAARSKLMYRHLVSIPQTQALLADMIASSPILFDADLAAATGAGGGGGGDMDENGIDPNMDPELAMVSDCLLAKCIAEDPGNPDVSCRSQCWPSKLIGSSEHITTCRSFRQLIVSPDALYPHCTRIKRE